MFTVYVLYSPLHHKIYIGYTANLQQRLLAHQCAARGATGAGTRLCTGGMVFR
ncbi:MAG: GIY-YIG nuclease family protein [Thermoflavifilum sp.]|uniref:GIY-YIG nuclease family protein n=1 Tax=Thermoflavifilum sp. TaxID=1968839 RepID=UPI0018A37DC1|nr:MAG: GIY-YIG nuclease family protein [Thermoflavifilum sp.]